MTSSPYTPETPAADTYSGGAAAGTFDPAAVAREAERAQKRLEPVAVAKGDKYIWGIYLALCLVSIIELYSASSREVAAASSFGVLGPVVRHVMILLVGFGVMVGLSRIHYKHFIAASYGFVLMSVVLMALVLAFGDIVNGARRSLTIAGFQLQPAEFIKMSAVLVVTLFMSRSQLSKGLGVSDKGMWWCALSVLFLGGLLAKQGLTNTMLVVGISLSLMLVGGVKIHKLLLVVAAYGLCGGLFVAYLAASGGDEKKAVEMEYVVVTQPDGAVRTQAVEHHEADDQKGGRLSTWIGRLSRFNSADSLPKYAQQIDAYNRQEMYSYMAQANGGLHGVGPGNSRESARLPLAFSDFIYSIIIEDMGLIGGLVVLVIYLALLGRASGIASRCSRAYPALLVLGMALMIVLQALAHMAINTGVSPVSGQPLPLISKGGSSILITSIAFGVMLSVSRFAVRNKGKRQQIKDEIDLLPEQMRADNPGAL